jgi:hypothetical protein
LRELTCISMTDFNMSYSILYVGDVAVP